ncbi:MAG: isoaspartyl peptidase/L-asparaginase [Chloroflexi bacterium]|nr:isoaspartyl peptidase/L-asparaginase [Chloroflexota bacterium]
MRYAIVVHGGAGGTSPEAEQGCRRAAQAGAKALRGGGSSLDAAVAAVQWMEDSGRFNAGAGAVLRLDGATIETDAAVATSAGLQGVVGAVRDVRNPVLLARAVAQETPHFMLTGEGASALAKALGLAPHPGPSARALERYRALREAIARGDASLLGAGWSEPMAAKLMGLLGGDEGQVPHEGDTVGAVALDSAGMFAVASSTGGARAMLLGRIGDVPFRRCGYQVGVLGGVAATGIGEEIMRREGAGKVYQLLEMGLVPQAACEAVVKLFPVNVSVGFIALTGDGVGVAANCPMATHAIVKG